MVTDPLDQFWLLVDAARSWTSIQTPSASLRSEDGSPEPGNGRSVGSSTARSFSPSSSRTGTRLAVRWESWTGLHERGGRATQATVAHPYREPRWTPALRQTPIDGSGRGVIAQPQPIPLRKPGSKLPDLTPFIKWPGGKSDELLAIAAAAPPLGGRYIDPSLVAAQFS